MRDFGEIVKDKGIPWVRHWIDATFEFSKNFVKSGTSEIDFEALGREEWEFRKALKTKDFSKNERAKYLWNEALNIHNRNANNGKKSPGRPKKSPQDAPNGNAGVDMSDAGNGAASKTPTSCDTLTADGDTREDSLAKPDGSAISRNETRAHDALEPSATLYYQEASDKISTGEARESRIGASNTADTDPGRGPEPGNVYGDAATREGADESTTVSRNMRRVPQNEAPAHGFSGGRTAQGTMSRSPEAAAQSGKAYDQETYRVSTDEARESQGRAGAQALAVRNLPRNKEEVRLFAIDNGLDVDDANDWAEMNLRERHGRDKDGKPIRNWKGAILNYCKAMAAKRETA